MKLTLNKWSALYLLRLLRVDRSQSRLLNQRTNLLDPDSAPLQRWGKSCFAKGQGPIGRI